MNFHLVKGDITVVHADAIVNAANSALAGGGGVDGAIHKAAGPSVMKECDLIRKREGGCPPGHAVITRAGNLNAKFIIHTVGPIWKGGYYGEDEVLRNAYRSSMVLAENNKVHSIAFPNISTGVYGFPKKRAAAIAIQTLKEIADQTAEIKDVYLVCHDEENYLIYQQELGSENH